MATLYCPNCGYNLTGLPENRCPECGQSFDPAAVRATALQPIELGEVIVRLAWPPATVLVSAALAMASDGALVFMVITCLLFVLIYGLINARQIARRLAVGRAQRLNLGHSGLQNRGLILGWQLGLYAVQLFLTVAGCGVCVIAGTS